VQIGWEADYVGRFVYKLPLNDEQLEAFQESCSSLDYSSLDSGVSSPPHSDPVLEYRQFLSHIRDLIEKFIPSKRSAPRTIKSRNYKAAPPWWNENCQKAVASRRDALAAFHHSSSAENLRGYQKAKKSCSASLRKEKRKCWKSLCNSFNGKTPTHRVWALAKLFRKRNLSTSSSLTGSAELISSQEAVISKLCPPACTSGGNRPLCDLLHEDFRSTNLCASLDQDITLHEVTLALKSMKKRSAPGIDQIDYRILKALPTNYLVQLTNIFNKLFQQGAFPEEWTESLVVFIPKPHGGGVRPISLLSCIFKILEKVIYFRTR
jgi:hypothetical protein